MLPPLWVYFPSAASKANAFSALSGAPQQATTPAFVPIKPRSVFLYFAFFSGIISICVDYVEREVLHGERARRKQILLHATEALPK